ncbi:MAG TPA: GGDEF domain-containing protein [Terracidiphilus sp.]|nr:GGDEF domain-containing protein [Terracidiphilus sp.]
MRADAEVRPPGQVDPNFLHRLFYLDHLCLFGAAIIAVVNIFPGIFVEIQDLFPASWLDMRTSCAVMTVCAATSLLLCEETQAEQWQWAGRSFAMLMVTIAAASFLAGISGLPAVVTRVLDGNQVSLRQGSLAFSAAAFLLLGIAILLVSSRAHKLQRIADGITILLSALVLTLVVGFFFALARVQGSSVTGLTSTPELWCLALLTVVVILRQAERGFLSVLWGYGTGSRIARILAPFLLALPLVREVLRAHLLRSGLIPAQYAAAILTSAGTIVGVTLLLLAARYINRMQQDIQGVTLRDDLTGLQSVKGFYLLAEQAFRYSRRVQEPFGVLFVDMDNLKMINDRLGHSVGSVSLVETAKLLSSTFRETDVIGRVGGDEFVVAGQFKQIELVIAIERLRDAVARKNQAAGQRFSISLSMGYAVTEDFAHETLQSLVKKADEAMYEEKRAKKQARAAKLAQSQVAQPGEAAP